MMFKHIENEARKERVRGSFCCEPHDQTSPSQEIQKGEEKIEGEKKLTYQIILVDSTLHTEVLCVMRIFFF